MKNKLKIISLLPLMLMSAVGLKSHHAILNEGDIKNNIKYINTGLTAGALTKFTTGSHAIDIFLTDVGIDVSCHQGQTPQQMIDYVDSLRGFHLDWKSTNNYFETITLNIAKDSANVQRFDEFIHHLQFTDVSEFDRVYPVTDIHNFWLSFQKTGQYPESNIPCDIDFEKMTFTLSLSHFLYFYERNPTNAIITYIEPTMSTNLINISSIELGLLSSLKLNDASRNLYLNVNDKMTQEDIVNNISATDMFGAPCEVVVVASNYVSGKVGDFVIELGAQDTYGQTATGFLNIHVTDSDKPVIGDISLTHTDNEDISFSKLISEISITDNYDRNIEPEITIGGTTINGDDYYDDPSATFGKLVIGEHEIKVVATDSSGNTTQKIGKLKITDGTAPIIEYKDGGDINAPLRVGSSFITGDITSYIKDLYKFTDIGSGIKSSELTFADNASSTPGEYRFTLVVTDNANNVATLNNKVVVYADLPPVILINVDLYLVKSGSKVTQNQVITLACEKHGVNTEDIETSSADMSIYNEKSTIPGDYEINYRIVTKGGNVISDKLTLRVLETTTEKTNENWFASFKTFFTDITHMTSDDWIHVSVISGSALVAVAILVIVIVAIAKRKDK